MAKVTFENGIVVNFEGTPSQKDIEEVAKTFPKTKEEWNTFYKTTVKPKREASFGTEVVSPIASGLSTAAFGLPKAAIEAIDRSAGTGFKPFLFPEQQTMAGKALRIGAEGAGLIGGGAGKIGASIAERVLPQSASGLGLKAPVGAIDAFKRAEAMKAIGRSAITGGVGGLSQVTGTEKDLASQVQRQVGQGIAGGVGGAAVAGVGKMFGGIPKSLQQSKQIGKQSEVGNREVVRGLLGERLRGLSAKVQSNVRGATENLNKEIETIKTKFTAYKDDFAKKISNEAETVGSKFQEAIPQYFRNTTKAYGDTLDEMISGLSNRGRGGKFIGRDVPADSVRDLLSKSLLEMEENGITSGKGYEGVRSYLGKISSPDAKDSIKVRDFLTEYKKIRSSYSPSFKGGSYLQQDDISTAIFNRNAGEYINGILPPGKLGSFKDLNNEYKAVVEAKKLAYKMFQPSKENLGGKTGDRLMRKIAKDGYENLSRQERSLIESIEQGSKFSKGVGELTQPLKALPIEARTAEASRVLQEAAARAKFNNFLKNVDVRKATIKNRDVRIKSIEAARAQADLIKKALYILGGVAGAGTAAGAASLRSSGVESISSQVGN